MTERERLIDILSTTIYPRIGADPAEVLADFLLDNGVIVPPCKKGDKFFYVDRGNNISKHICYAFFRFELTGEVALVDTHGPAYPESVVYFSREEAEAAVKEREQI